MAGGGIGGFLAREIRGLLPPTVFFLVAFGMLALTAELSGNPRAFSYTSAALSALVCGKATLIANNWVFLNRFPRRPLIWNIATKSLFYTALSTAVRLVEGGVHGFLASRRLGAGTEAMLAEFSWAHFVLVQAWIGVLFVVYTSFGELVGAIGRERMRRLIFGPVEGGVA